jgi:DNA-binding MarR family transcriptional regulator
MHLGVIMQDWNITSGLVGLKVHKIHTALKTLLNAKLIESGWNITPEQWATIHFLKQNPGLTQSVIAQKTCKDQTSVTRSLDRLEKKELIERKRDKSDRRIYKIFLTKHTEKMYEETKSYIEDYNIIVKESLEEEEGKLFLSILDKITNSITEKTISIS